MFTIRYSRRSMKYFRSLWFLIFGWKWITLISHRPFMFTFHIRTYLHLATNKYYNLKTHNNYLKNEWKKLFFPIKLTLKISRHGQRTNILRCMLNAIQTLKLIVRQSNKLPPLPLKNCAFLFLFLVFVFASAVARFVFFLFACPDLSHQIVEYLKVFSLGSKQIFFN